MLRIPCSQPAPGKVFSFPARSAAAAPVKPAEQAVEQEVAPEITAQEDEDELLLGADDILTSPVHRVEVLKNTISGNTAQGVLIVNSDFVSVSSNVIGLNKLGTAALANGGHGVELLNASEITIGDAFDGLTGALLWHFAAMWLLAVNGVIYVTLGILTGRFSA